MKVLIVDDNKTTSKFVARALAKAGYETRQAYNGFQAMHHLHEEPDIDAAIIDVMMPRMDGFELVDWIRSESPCRNLPVVICSGRRDLETIQASLDRHCKYYLVKPVAVRELLRKLHLAINGERQADEVA